MRHNSGGCILVYVCSWVCITYALVFLLLLSILSSTLNLTPKGASLVITIHLELGSTRDITYMVISTLQQIIDERIPFLKEQINQDNKPDVNKTFQLQIDVIRSIDDIEKVEFIINEKKALLKNSKDVHESDRLFAELDGLEWVQRQIEIYA
jgi:hypothetical protein